MSILKFLILGFLTSLLFPPYFFLPIGFIIFPYICIYIEKNFFHLSKIKKFLIIFSFGFSFFLSFLYWIQNPFFVYEETKNFFLVSIILIILLAFIFSFIFIITLSFTEIVPIFFRIPLAFILFEYLISIIFYGFPWINFSLITANNLYLTFPLKNFGTIINSYLIVQVFCIPYLIFKKKYFNELIYLVIFIITPLSLAFIYNKFVEKSYIPKLKEISLEIIQLNNNQSIVNEFPDKIEKKIFELIGKSKSNLIIFGENNYPNLIKLSDIKYIQSLLKEDQTVIIGGTRYENKKFYNTLLNLNDSEIIFFDKKILVPFGEFLPLRNFFKFFEKISGPFDFSKGKKDRIIYLEKNISYIPVICYEIIFYWKLINSYNYDSDFVVNITNDIWFGNYLGPYQHFYLTKLRAIEFNKPVVRVSNNGISGIIDSKGQILSKTVFNDNNYITASLEFNKEPNFFIVHYLLKIYFVVLFITILVLNFFIIYGRKKL